MNCLHDHQILWENHHLKVRWKVDRIASQIAVVHRHHLAYHLFHQLRQVRSSSMLLIELRSKKQKTGRLLPIFNLNLK